MRLTESDLRADILEQQLLALRGRGSSQGVIAAFADLLFVSGSHELSASSPRLRQLAALMREHPQRHAVIAGFTDNQGRADDNLRLSGRRAHGVMVALIALGVSPLAMRAEGRGEAAPVADNQSDAGRRLNRRVEVMLEAIDLSVIPH